MWLVVTTFPGRVQTHVHLNLYKPVAHFTLILGPNLLMPLCKLNKLKGKGTNADIIR